MCYSIFNNFNTDIFIFHRPVKRDGRIRDSEREIIESCLSGAISEEKIKKFINYTVMEKDYTEYKWTWCGRYSIPFGLSIVKELENLTGEKLNGKLVGYSTSIDHPHIKVSDLKMGVTAPANIHHWVGYTAMGYK